MIETTIRTKGWLQTQFKRQLRRIAGRLASPPPLFIPALIPPIDRHTDKQGINESIAVAIRATGSLRRSADSISTVFRVKNAEETIAVALLSFLPVSSEIVVVDNGSTDGTWDTLLRLQRQLSPYVPVKLFQYPQPIALYGDDYGRAVREQPNSSIANFYNFSFSQATCEYVLKADAGCILLPFGARHILEQLASSPAVVMTTGVEIFGRRIDFEPRLFRRELGLRYLDGEHFEYLDLSAVEGSKQHRQKWITDPIFIHLSALSLQRQARIAFEAEDYPGESSVRFPEG